MIIELAGVDILLGARAAYDERPIGGRLYGAYIRPLGLMVAVWVM